jgi:type II secretory pathway component GspD/PulD (secretin)
LCGCHSTGPQSPSAKQEQRAFTLQTIAPEQAVAILSDLELGMAIRASEPNTLLVGGLPGVVEKAGIILSLIDANEPFVVQALAPATQVRTLPSNDQFAEAIQDIAIGTFANPPAPGQMPRALIDICGESVVAIAPARLWPEIRAVAELGPQARRSRARPAPEEHAPNNLPSGAISPGEPGIAPDQDATPIITASVMENKPASPRPAAADTRAPNQPRGRSATPEKTLPLAPPTSGTAEEGVVPQRATAATEPRGGPEILRGVLKPPSRVEKPVAVSPSEPPISFSNGDDVLELSLPEKIELVQLLDLAGTYLKLDCIYEQEKIGNQVITLKLHSKQRSDMRVKDLYSLLETVLKFKGLVMTRREGNFVTIVPAAEALEVDPQLVDPNNRALQAGDMVITRVFELHYVDVASVTNLLQSMKLSVAVSPVADTQTLFVTCYAHRMARVEQLVDMIDRPGRAREFRFRQLKYTMAAALCRKVLALAQEFQGITITVGATDTNPSAPPRAPRPAPGTAESRNLPSAAAIYLDTDERTNRMLMIGPSEQLEILEGLIDTLDVPQQDLRAIQVYAFEHVDASDALDKLLQLGVIDRSAHGASRAAKTSPTAAGALEAAPGEQPQVVLLETTNSLLVNATGPQHEQIQRITRYLDVAPQDLRTLKVYAIKHMDAEDVARKLQQLQAVGQVAAPMARPLRIAQAGGPVQATPAVMTSAMDVAGSDNSQVVVLEVTNSLLINATAPQHQRIEKIIERVDTEATKQIIPYEIYFLENQDPEQLAAVLSKLIQETITSADGKIEKVLPRTDEQVTIIPDKNTFSLIVRADRKNQDWIAGLVERLDRRRPQVLIDVTLVEITETEAFNYDLTIIASAPDLTATSGSPPITSTDITNKLAASGRSHFADFQSNSGDLTAFYGDRHINLLLRAIQAKNYGRILAKPKILVNDNEPGLIKSTDTTYVARQSSIPVTSGAGGTQTSLIQTAVDYQSYEAGITLNITPHISQGDLLRLEIELTRSDFRPTEDMEKPPDQTASELKTTVFVPDASTIILGGLVRLNQNKGGTKVPILGDIPLVGGLFRSINNRDAQSKLYVFVKTEIIRPAGLLANGAEDLQALSERNREAFEKHERQFQKYESWPGIKSKPVEPAKVLEAD